MATSEFYDTLAPYYHLIYADWEVSIGRQSRALDAIIRATVGPQARSVRRIDGKLFEPVLVGCKRPKPGQGSAAGNG